MDRIVSRTQSPAGPSAGRPRPPVVAAAATVLALVAVASCGGSDDPPSAATTAPATTAAAPVEPAVLKPIEPEALQALVDETMKDMLVPGAVVVLRTPEGDVTATYGVTELGGDTRPDADTNFRIASITKTMTSAVILLLAQEGKLKLDDPVSKYEPQVPNGDNITLAQLLEMRSGLYSFTDAPEISAGHGRRSGQGLDAAGAARHRLRPAGDVRARRRLLLQQHQLRPARSDHRAVGRQAAGRIVRGAVVRAARHDRHVLPGPDRRLHPGSVLARLPVRQRLPRDDGHPLHAGDAG